MSAVHHNESQPLVWNHRFANLGEDFVAPLDPTPLPAVHWIHKNQRLLKDLGWPNEGLNSPEALLAFSGCAIPQGAQPFASVYSGHQFGVWAGQLGDGRAITLGDVDSANGPQEVQLKGAGPTPYSRRGDGRAVLRSSIREYLCSEAMHGLGIPTTRALCLTGSPQPIRREEVETAAVVTRTAPSFLRFGHFEHFSANEQHLQLRVLADHALSVHLPECHARASSGEHQGNIYAVMLQTVCDRTAHMVAQWQAVGFCHGVMNTDNMSLLGLTLDYGPFQFMDGFDPMHICNHTDQEGRYAYARQPKVAYWNLFCLGQALMPLIDDADATVKALEAYQQHLPRETERIYAKKLGLTPREAGSGLRERASPEKAQHSATQLAQAILEEMSKTRVDYSIFWRQLSLGVRDYPLLSEVAFEPCRDLFSEPSGFDAWMVDYLRALKQQDLKCSAQEMLSTNPKFVLRNHLCEIAIRQAKTGDFSEIERLLTVLRAPFDEHPDMASYADHPPAWAQSIEISCSS